MVIFLTLPGSANGRAERLSAWNRRQEIIDIIEEISTSPETDAPGPRRPPKWLGHALVGIFFVLCGYYVRGHWEEFAFVRTIRPLEIIAAGVLIFVSLGVNALQFQLFLGTLGVRAGRFELMALTMGMMLGNIVLPLRGGTGAMAVYLRRVHGLDLHLFAMIYAGTALLVALINCGLALVGLVLLAALYGFFHLPLTALVVCMFVTCLYFCLFPPTVGWKGSGVWGMVLEAVRSWHLLTRDRRTLAMLALSHVCLALLLAGSFHLIYQALGLSLSMGAVLITSSLGNIAALVPVTPGSLGIFDAVVIQIPRLFGLEPAGSMAAALAYRLLCMSWALVLGLPGLLWLIRSRRQTE